MANTYLTSNTGTATNAKKFTLSMWIKRGNLSGSTAQRFYQGYKDGNNRFYIMFDSTSGNPDTLWIYAVTGGTIELYWSSNRKFRDTNGWYHFVFSADSTQASQGDRFKVYVNGVEETSWTKTNNPSQNIDWGNQLAQTNNDLTISGTESQSQLFDGSMSHINFIDGTAYDATAFGEYDANGVWTINTSPSVTYGTNGFFILKDSASVTDQSGNGNNFTVGGGTLTDTLDCSANVFATMNPLDNYYNSSTFTNGNNTVQTGTSQYTYNTSTLGVSSGKWYCEIEYDATTSADNALIGITSEFSTASTEELGDNSNDWGYYATGEYRNNNSWSSYGNTYTVGDIIGIALDLDNNKLYFSKNGTWQNSGDPTSGATGTGAISITDPASTNIGSYFIAICHYDASSNGTYKANFGNGYFGTTAVASAGTNASGNGIFEYDVPTGYTALSTKGLNL